MFETGEPHHKAELIAALRGLQSATTAYLSSLPVDAFFRPQGNAWAPAAHVRHLVWSVRLVGHGLRWPRLGLRLLFGHGDGSSRDFAAMRAAYRAVLANGGRAPFTPSGRSSSAEPADGRTQLLARLDAAVEYLLAGAARWDERDLDRLRLPHPLLGKLTVREMLCFTLYHNAHHVRRIAERVERAEAPVPGRPTS